ncbi:hypothetical protein DZF91_03635, partial [Actinomadura logoneensis]
GAAVHAAPRAAQPLPRVGEHRDGRPGTGNATAPAMRLARTGGETPGGSAGSANQMSPIAKSVRKLIRSAGIPVPGSDAGPNDPQVPPRLPIEGLPLAVAGKKIPFLSGG